MQNNNAFENNAGTSSIPLLQPFQYIPLTGRKDTVSRERGRRGRQRGRGRLSGGVLLPRGLRDPASLPLRDLLRFHGKYQLHRVSALHPGIHLPQREHLGSHGALPSGLLLPRRYKISYCQSG